MKATKHDILDLVETTVHDLCLIQRKPVPMIILTGDTIMIGSTPVAITDIEAQRYKCKGFVALIKGALE